MSPTGIRRLLSNLSLRATVSLDERDPKSGLDLGSAAKMPSSKRQKHEKEIRHSRIETIDAQTDFILSNRHTETPWTQTLVAGTAGRLGTYLKAADMELEASATVVTVTAIRINAAENLQTADPAITRTLAKKTGPTFPCLQTSSKSSRPICHR